MVRMRASQVRHRGSTPLRDTSQRVSCVGGEFGALTER